MIKTSNSIQIIGDLKFLMQFLSAPFHDMDASSHSQPFIAVNDRIYSALWSRLPKGLQGDTQWIKKEELKGKKW